MLHKLLPAAGPRHFLLCLDMTFPMKLRFRLCQRLRRNSQFGSTSFQPLPQQRRTLALSDRPAQNLLDVLIRLKLIKLLGHVSQYDVESLEAV